METKHTKGEWKIGNSFAELCTDINSDNGKRICEVKHYKSIVNDSTYKEGLANAKLIAQSPELLQVCMDLLSAFQHKEGDIKGNKVRTAILKYCPEFRELAVKARNVIEKATI